MKILATLGAMVTAIVYTLPAAAEGPPPAAAEDAPDLEIYGTLLPFFENVGTRGATPAPTPTFNPNTAPNVVPSDRITGGNHERRFRMTSGTSHIGFRGGLPIAGEALKLVWQVESPTPIDGEGPGGWASRNSHVGFTGSWGTLIYGNWDTPMKWASATSVNPIKGGYVADHIALIGAPGGLTPALNPDAATIAIFQFFNGPNRAGFFRHEANAVQYWSPTIAGLSARLMFVANEHRTYGATGEPPLNPYLVSGYVGYDNSWLRLRGAAELHKDYFGTANVGGEPPGPPTHRGSTDVGLLGLAMVTINADTDYKTRLVALGDYLSYHTDYEPVTGFLTDYSRPAFYALLQQSFGSHNVWGAYGMAMEGKCSVGPAPGALPPACPTIGLSAQYFAGGYLYSFTPGSGVFVVGYGLLNDIMARYSPFPYMDRGRGATNYLPNVVEVTPGSDTIGFGIGFVHSFNVGIFGQDPPPAAPAPAATKAEAPAAEAKEPRKPEAKEAGAEGASKVDLEEEEEEEEEEKEEKK